MRFNQKSEDVIKELGSDLDHGFNDAEILESREKYGYNELVEEDRRSLLLRFFDQFKDAMIIMLIIAAVVSIIVEPNEWLDSLIIMVVVIFNAIIGLTQESKAEESLQALKQMSAPLAKVLRNDRKINIPSREVVVGDVIFLEAGDFVPADARLIEVHNLKIDESSLTGESNPVSKDIKPISNPETALGDRINMAFASSMVTYSSGTAIVT